MIKTKIHCLLLVIHTLHSAFILFWPRDYSDAFLLQLANLLGILHPESHSLKENKLSNNDLYFDGNTG